MSLLNIALGFLRDAVSQRAEQEIVEAVRPEGEVDVLATLTRHRVEVNANLEALAGALRQQHSRMEQALRRQRQWNYALAAATLVALAVAVWAAV